MVDYRLVQQYHDKLRSRPGTPQNGLRHHLHQRLQAELHKVEKAPSTAIVNPAVPDANPYPWNDHATFDLDLQADLSDQALLDMFAHNIPKVQSPIASTEIPILTEPNMPGWPAFLLDLFNGNTEGPADQHWMGF